MLAIIKRYRVFLEGLFSACVAPTLINLVSNAIGTGDYLTAISVVGFVLTGVYLFYLSTPRTRERQLPDYCSFQLVDADGKWEWWRRPERLRDAEQAVRHAGSKVVVAIAGPSGAGKSTLLRDGLAPQLWASGYEVVHKDEYPGYLPKPEFKEPNRKPVVIFDQFEHLLHQVERLGTVEAGAILQRTRSDIEALLDAGVIVVISVRDESYYDLRFLSPHLPQVEQSVDVGLISSSSEPDIVERFLERMRSLGADTKGISADGFSLLEAQARLVLQRLQSDTDCAQRIGFEDPDTHEAPQILVDWYVDDAPEPGIATRLLYALILRPAGCGLSVQEITYVIGDRAAKVRGICKYLEERGLVKYESETSRYEAAHDALREPIEIIAAERLKPNERDCIVAAVQAAEEQGWKPKFIAAASIARFSLAAPVMGLLVAMGLARLFIPWSGWGVISHLPSTARAVGSADPIYLAIFVPHLLWCLYVALHDWLVFRYRDVGNWQRAVSHLTVINLILCVLCGMFLPEFWICAIAWGGIGQALKSLEVSFRHDLGPVGIRIFRRRAVATMLNMIATMAAGLAFGWAVISGLLPSDGAIMGAAYLGSFILTLEMAALWESHISDEEAGYLKNLLRHRRSSTKWMAENRRGADLEQDAA